MKTYKHLNLYQIEEGFRMNFKLPYPVSHMMTEGQKELWRQIYKELNEPRGHIISASYKTKCTCPTCLEYIKRSA